MYSLLLSRSSIICSFISLFLSIKSRISFSFVSNLDSSSLIFWPRLSTSSLFDERVLLVSSIYSSFESIALCIASTCSFSNWICPSWSLFKVRMYSLLLSRSSIICSFISLFLSIKSRISFSFVSNLDSTSLIFWPRLSTSSLFDERVLLVSSIYSSFESIALCIASTCSFSNWICPSWSLFKVRMYSLLLSRSSIICSFISLFLSIKSRISFSFVSNLDSTSLIFWPRLSTSSLFDERVLLVSSIYSSFESIALCIASTCSFSNSICPSWSLFKVRMYSLLLSRSSIICSFISLFLSIKSRISFSFVSNLDSSSLIFWFYFSIYSSFESIALCIASTCSFSNSICPSWSLFKVRMYSLLLSRSSIICSFISLFLSIKSRISFSFVSNLDSSSLIFWPRLSTSSLFDERVLLVSSIYSSFESIALCIASTCSFSNSICPSWSLFKVRMYSLLLSRSSIICSFISLFLSIKSRISFSFVSNLDSSSLIFWPRLSTSSLFDERVLLVSSIYSSFESIALCIASTCSFSNSICPSWSLFKVRMYSLLLSRSSIICSFISLFLSIKSRISFSFVSNLDSSSLIFWPRLSTSSLFDERVLLVSSIYSSFESIALCIASTCSFSNSICPSWSIFKVRMYSLLLSRSSIICSFISLFLSIKSRISFSFVSNLDSSSLIFWPRLSTSSLFDERVLLVSSIYSSFESIALCIASTCSFSNSICPSWSLFKVRMYSLLLSRSSIICSFISLFLPIKSRISFSFVSNLDSSSLIFWFYFSIYSSFESIALCIASTCSFSNWICPSWSLFKVRMYSLLLSRSSIICSFISLFLPIKSRISFSFVSNLDSTSLIFWPRLSTSSLFDERVLLVSSIYSSFESIALCIASTCSFSNWICPSWSLFKVRMYSLLLSRSSIICSFISLFLPIKSRISFSFVSNLDSSSLIFWFYFSIYSSFESIALCIASTCSFSNWICPSWSLFKVRMYSLLLSRSSIICSFISLFLPIKSRISFSFVSNLDSSSLIFWPRLSTSSLFDERVLLVSSIYSSFESIALCIASTCSFSNSICPSWSLFKVRMYSLLLSRSSIICSFISLFLPIKSRISFSFVSNLDSSSLIFWPRLSTSSLFDERVLLVSSIYSSFESIALCIASTCSFSNSICPSWSLFKVRMYSLLLSRSSIICSFISLFLPIKSRISFSFVSNLDSSSLIFWFYFSIYSSFESIALCIASTCSFSNSICPSWSLFKVRMYSLLLSRSSIICSFISLFLSIKSRISFSFVSNLESSSLIFWPRLSTSSLFDERVLLVSSIYSSFESIALCIASTCSFSNSICPSWSLFKVRMYSLLLSRSSIICSFISLFLPIKSRISFSFVSNLDSSSLIFWFYFSIYSSFESIALCIASTCSFSNWICPSWSLFKVRMYSLLLSRSSIICSFISLFLSIKSRISFSFVSNLDSSSLIFWFYFSIYSSFESIALCIASTCSFSNWICPSWSLFKVRMYSLLLSRSSIICSFISLFLSIKSRISFSFVSNLDSSSLIFWPRLSTSSLFDERVLLVSSIYSSFESIALCIASTCSFSNWICPSWSLFKVRMYSLLLSRSSIICSFISLFLPIKSRISFSFVSNLDSSSLIFWFYFSIYSSFDERVLLVSSIYSSFESIALCIASTCSFSNWICPSWSLFKVRMYSLLLSRSSIICSFISLFLPIKSRISFSFVSNLDSSSLIFWPRLSTSSLFDERVLLVSSIYSSFESIALCIASTCSFSNSICPSWSLFKVRMYSLLLSRSSIICSFISLFLPIKSRISFSFVSNLDSSSLIFWFYFSIYSSFESIALCIASTCSFSNSICPSWSLFKVRMYSLLLSRSSIICSFISLFLPIKSRISFSFVSNLDSSSLIFWPRLSTSSLFDERVLLVSSIYSSFESIALCIASTCSFSNWICPSWSLFKVRMYSLLLSRSSIICSFISLFLPIKSRISFSFVSNLDSSSLIFWPRLSTSSLFDERVLLVSSIYSSFESIALCIASTCSFSNSICPSWSLFKVRMYSLLLSRSSIICSFISLFLPIKSRISFSFVSNLDSSSLIFWPRLSTSSLFDERVLLVSSIYSSFESIALCIASTCSFSNWICPSWSLFKVRMYSLLLSRSSIICSFISLFLPIKSRISFSFVSNLDSSSLIFWFYFSIYSSFESIALCIASTCSFSNSICPSWSLFKVRMYSLLLSRSSIICSFISLFLPIKSRISFSFVSNLDSSSLIFWPRLSTSSLFDERVLLVSSIYTSFESIALCIASTCSFSNWICPSWSLFKVRMYSLLLSRSSIICSFISLFLPIKSRISFSFVSNLDSSSLIFWFYLSIYSSFESIALCIASTCSFSNSICPSWSLFKVRMYSLLLSRSSIICSFISLFLSIKSRISFSFLSNYFSFFSKFFLYISSILRYSFFYFSCYIIFFYFIISFNFYIFYS